MSSHKDKYGKTRLGMFITKASKFIPEIVDAGFKLGTGNVSGAIEEVSDLLFNNKGINQEVKNLQFEFEVKKLDFAKECFELEVRDRESARLDGDKHLQRVVAYFSLLGFTFFGAIQVWLSYKILMNSLEVNEFIIMTASNIFGIFTGLIFTLKDFLFGGSVDR